MTTDERKHRLKFWINYFEAIPDELWCVDWRTSVNAGYEQHCALGHAAEAKPDGDLEIGSLFDTSPYWGSMMIADINNAYPRYSLASPVWKYRQPTPKARVLAALYDLLSEVNGISVTQPTDPMTSPECCKIVSPVRVDVAEISSVPPGADSNGPETKNKLTTREN